MAESVHQTEPGEATPESIAKDLHDLRQQWEVLKTRFEISERNNDALCAHVQDLLKTVIELNSSLMVWKCIAALLTVALIVAVMASLLVL